LSSGQFCSKTFQILVTVATSEGCRLENARSVSYLHGAISIHQIRSSDDRYRVDTHFR